MAFIIRLSKNGLPSHLFHVKCSVFAALPGEGGGSGAGGSRREAAAGGDPHGPGGGSAQQPQTPGSGKLPQRPTGQPSTGTHTLAHKPPHTHSSPVHFSVKAELLHKVLGVLVGEVVDKLSQYIAQVQMETNTMMCMLTPSHTVCLYCKRLQ